MGDKLCVMTYVFGENYQTFIPLYVYSVWKAYPEYDTVIYTKGKLPPKVDEQLALLRGNCCTNFTILQAPDIGGLSHKAKKSDVVDMAMRWLILPDFLKKYKAAYIGDIDLFICGEEPSLFDQHEAHCRYMGMPYSNYARFFYPQNSMRLLVKRTRDYGLKSALHRLKNLPATIPRLSGLHYFQVKGCYDRVKSAIPDMVIEINDIFDGKHDRLNLACLDNEWVLYRLYERAGLPRIEPKKLAAMELMSRRNPESEIFRPHHGLHIGIWRNYSDGKFAKQENQYLAQSSAYIEYYKYVKQILEGDFLFQKLLDDKDLFAVQIFNRMLDFYENHLNA
jgi:hypothetical protein